MTKPLLPCPNCGSNDIDQNGTTRYKQHDKSRACRRQCVENPKWQRSSDATRAPIERLLLEKILLAGIARRLQLSERGLQQYVKAYDTKVPQPVPAQPKTALRLKVQMDDLWSFGAAPAQ